jgi:DtxR family Mn-dependent transcriptional regulator
VARVRDDDPAFLRYLAGLGIVLQSRLVVTEKAPFDGPVHITIGDQSHALGKSVTDKIFVEVE